MAVIIKTVHENSPAQKSGISAGQTLLKINGHEINDGLDYGFYSSAASLEIAIKEIAAPVIVNKEEYEDLGLGFESYLIDKQHACRNRCIFCFVDQMPKGLRKSLYFKDDDERLSFLFGNYISLTNIAEKEVERIIDMRIQPINISVHTTNPALRCEIMKNPNAGKVLEYIEKFSTAGIEMNAQLVLMPGINDGAELERSIADLAKHRPAIKSLAAVPVGLTKFRDDLPHIDIYTQEKAAEQLDIMLKYGDEFAKEGGRFIFPSDEWFLLAGRSLPAEDFYEGYPQLENGVGMWRSFYDDFCYALDNAKAPLLRHSADVITGSLAAGLMQELSEKLAQKLPKCQMTVHKIENNFFGNGVTVTGLLTGKDIIEQLKGKTKSKTLILPSVILRSEGDITLDGMSMDDIGKALDVKVKLNTGSAEGLLAFFAKGKGK